MNGNRRQPWCITPIEASNTRRKSTFDCSRGMPLCGSMSRRANPYDNARCESFFKTLKQVAGGGQLICESGEWHGRLNQYLTYYNQTRLHSALDYQSPAAYEKQADEKHWMVAGSSSLGAEFFQA